MVAQKVTSDEEPGVIQLIRFVLYLLYLLVDDVHAASAFYVEYLGFERATQLDWFVSLSHMERPEYKIDLVQRDHRGHEVVPAPAGVVLAFSSTTPSRRTLGSRRRRCRS